MKYALLFLLFISLIRCKKEPDLSDSQLDMGLMKDSSLIVPENYLWSAKLKNPTETQKQIPILIAVHGYSATTFEWQEFKRYTDTIANLGTSLVLLGGHGRSYEAFKNSSWQDWEQTIVDEYHKLDSMGYKRIYLVGSSTACPLILDMLSTKKYSPRQVFFIDPIIVSANKTLTLVDIAQISTPYIKSDLAAGEINHWYKYRPVESLKQLMNLLNLTRKRLEKGMILDENTKLSVYKSKYDATADAVSAVLLYKGIKNADGSPIEVRMIDSDLHVFTRLQGRNIITEAQRELQLKTFQEILAAVKI